MAKGEEGKTAFMSLRLRPSVKAIAERLAAEDGRSVNNWIERLIESAAKTEAEPPKGKGRK